MASIGDTTRPAFAYDSVTDTWIPVGIGPHSHTPAAIGAISSSLVTTKGDLIAATSSGVVDRLAVGANGTTIVADSSTTTGLKWAAPASTAQNFTLLSTSTLSTGTVSTFTVSSLSGYNQLLIYIDGASTTGANPVYTFRLNADSTSKYVTNGTRFNGTTVYGQWLNNLNTETAFNLATGSGAAGGYTMMQILLSGANSSGVKTMQSTSSVDATSTGYWGINQGIYTGTSVISSVSLISSVGTFDSGTMYIYGAA